MPKKLFFFIAVIIILNGSIYAMQSTMTDKQKLFRSVLLRDLPLGTIIPTSCGIFAAITCSGDTTREKILIPLVSGMCGALSSLLGIGLGVHSANKTEKKLIGQKKNPDEINSLICNHLNVFSFKWTCASGLLIGMGTIAFIKLKNDR
jgi:hypothetical protein